MMVRYAFDTITYEIIDVECRESRPVSGHYDITAASRKMRSATIGDSDIYRNLQDRCPPFRRDDTNRSPNSRLQDACNSLRDAQDALGCKTDHPRAMIHPEESIQTPLFGYFNDPLGTPSEEYLGHPGATDIPFRLEVLILSCAILERSSAKSCVRIY